LSGAAAGPISAAKGGVRVMDIGLKQRGSARRQQGGARQQRRPSGPLARREPRPAGDRPAKQEGGPPSLWSIVGDAVHGVVFLVLTAAALLYFGQVFDVVAAVVAILAVMSLREAWEGLRRHRSK
jgi:hypothetical protein